ncbi:MAG: SPOR domain-containing protein, partial [Paracoccaceae bacterium]
MIRYFFVLVVALGLSLPHRAQAQDTAWVQVEAQPTLAGAQDRVRDYANRLENVAGFYLGGPWYGVVLGPYNRPDAEALLSDLRNQGRIPADSFVVDGSTFRQQFWPIGVGATTSVQPLPGAGASQRQSCAECKSIRVLDCKAYRPSRNESWVHRSYPLESMPARFADLPGRPSAASARAARQSDSAARR